MPLYHVQDDETPLFVIADDFAKAIEKWRVKVAEDADAPIGEIEGPKGVTYMCDDDELLS